VNEYGGEESPEKDMIPHLTERDETRICTQSHNIHNGIQFTVIVRFREHDHNAGERQRESEREDKKLKDFFSFVLATNLEVFSDLMFAI